MSQCEIEQVLTSAATVDVEGIEESSADDMTELEAAATELEAAATELEAAATELEAAATALTALFLEGGASRNANATQKFRVGDLVRCLFEIQNRAEAQSVLPGAPQEARDLVHLCRKRLRELLDGHDVTRGTLVNYGKVAGVFRAEHPIRESGLAFAFAKTLSSLETEEDRDYWYKQVVLMKLSIRQLQEELSSRRGPESGITNKRKQSKAYICAQTHRDIAGADLKTMVTLYLPAAAASELKVIKRQRRNARNPSVSETDSSTTAPHKILRFRDVAALASYISEHQSEYPLASAINTADADAAVSGKSNPPVSGSSPVSDRHQSDNGHSSA